MKTLNYYIVKTLFFYTLSVMLVWIGIYALFNFVQEIDLVGQHKYTLASAMIYVLADLPSVIYTYSTFIIFLGCLLGLGHLVTTSQIVIIRSCGISIMQIAQKTIIAALIFIFSVILLGEFVVPTTIEYAKYFKEKSLGRAINQQDFWIKDGDTIINIGESFSSQVFGDITLIELNNDRRLNSISYSNKALFNGKNLKLKKSKHYQLSQVGKLYKIKFKNYQEYVAKVSFDKSLIKVLEKMPNALSNWELYKHIEFLLDNNLSAQIFEIELYKRMIKPIALAAMLLLSMLFIFGSLRDSTFGKKMFIGIIIGLFFELSSRIGSMIALRFDYNALFSVSAPTLVILIISFLLLRRESAK